MRWTTEGEKLFFLVREQATASEDDSGAIWPRVGEMLYNIGGSPGFPAFVAGAIAVHAMRRLMRYWAHEKSNVLADHMQIKRISRFVTDDLFPGLQRDVVTHMARLVVRADAASSRPISPGTRKSAMARLKTLRCYLCAAPLDKDAPQGHVEFLTLEHLWPSSLGGDSAEENLLPACVRCQQAKADAISWEWCNVHNLVLPPSPSAEALKGISWPIRIARHYERVMGICERQRLSLKEAFQELGPVQHGIEYVRAAADTPVTFFHL